MLLLQAALGLPSVVPTTVLPTSAPTTDCTGNGMVQSAQKISSSYGGLSSFYTNDWADYFGSSSSGLGDLDGDGVADLVVGAYGEIAILFLTKDGLVKSARKISSTEGGLSSFYSVSSLGLSVTNLGDLDGDGVVDITVGTNARCVYVLFLTTDGLVKSAQKISKSYGGLSSFYTLDDGDYFGWSCAEIGDLDGDGVADLVVGAYLDGDGGTYAGAVYVLFLTTDAIVKSAQKISNSYGGFSTFYTLSGTSSGSTSYYFGKSCDGIGDLNGDGVVDIVIGAGDSEGNTQTGAVYVIFLTTDGFTKSVQKISNYYGDLPYSLGYWCRFGSSASSVGDINGDDVVDLGVGAFYDYQYGDQSGAVYVLFLTTSGLVNSAQKISNFYGGLSASITLDKDDQFGYSVSSLGDLDGDRVAELVVGAK